MEILTTEDLDKLIVAAREKDYDFKIVVPPALYEYVRELYEGDFWWIKEWLNKEEGEYYDDAGGLHSPGNCYNPKGYYCGDCGKKTCVNCDIRHLEPGTEPYHFLEK